MRNAVTSIQPPALPFRSHIAVMLSQVLKETCLVEAFNLKAAIEYNMKSFAAAREALADAPPRTEEELDPVKDSFYSLLDAAADLGLQVAFTRSSSCCANVQPKLHIYIVLMKQTISLRSLSSNLIELMCAQSLLTVLRCKSDTHAIVTSKLHCPAFWGHAFFRATLEDCWLFQLAVLLVEVLSLFQPSSYT